MKQIPGYKILVRGNHDFKKRAWYINHGFNIAVDALLFNDTVFSHEPFDISDTDVVYNVHGHFHRAIRSEEDRTAKGYDFYTKNHAYLSIEEEDYKPILLEEFMKRF